MQLGHMLFVVKNLSATKCYQGLVIYSESSLLTFQKLFRDFYFLHVFNKQDLDATNLIVLDYIRLKLLSNKIIGTYFTITFSLLNNLRIPLDKKDACLASLFLKELGSVILDPHSRILVKSKPL